MEDRSRTPLALSLLALFALLLRGVVPSPPAIAQTDSQPRPAVDSGDGAPTRTDPAVCVLRDFLGSGDDLDVEKPLRGALRGFALDSFVALMPHPTLTRLTSVFDTHVQSMQRALEEAGYLLDRYWLPWTPGKGAATETRPLRTACGEVAPDSSPGVLLFREADPAGQGLLLVLLVPESPRSGVEVKALRSALRVAAWAEEIRPGPPSGPTRFRILGPTFSGSVHSLRRALASWSDERVERRPARRVRFEIVSGSVTDAGSVKALRATDGVVFHTSLHSDEYVQRLFFHYLENRDRARPGTACPTAVEDPPKILERVALLVESSTTYGRSILDGASDQEPTRAPEGYLRIPFPMHVGQLRAEWIKAAPGRETRPRTPVDIPQEVLDLPAEDLHTGQDVLPAFSSLTAPIDNLVLAHVLPVLARHRIAYVGLVATDVQDRLFLGRLVRRYCPDVTLFALGSDLLYTHPQYARDLEGMLLASTYPLFTDNQAWTYPHRGSLERLQFPTSEAQGVFNATLALIGQPDLLAEYGLPLLETDEETLDRQPPVWVSAVGRGGLWPVAALCLQDEPDPVLFSAGSGATGHTRTSHPERTTITSPTFFKVYALAFVLLCVLHAAAYFTVLRGKQRWAIVWRLFAILEPSRDSDRAFVQRLYLFGSFLILSAVYAWITVPLALRIGTDLRYERGLFWETGVLVLGWVALLAPMVDTARWCWASARSRAGRLASVGAVVLSAAPLFLLLATVVNAFGSWTDFVKGTPVERAWIASFYFRSTSLGSGLSPLLPLLFLGLALYLWSLSELRRLHLGESARDHSVVAHLADDDSIGLGTLKDRADGLLEDSFRNLRVCFLLIAVVAAFFVLTLGWLPPSLDGRYFVRLFELLLFCVLVAINFEFTRFVLCWVCLRRMLRRFAGLPMSGALKRMPAVISSEPLLDLARAGPGLGIFRATLERWEALAKAWEARPRGREPRVVSPLDEVLSSGLQEAAVQVRSAALGEASSAWVVEGTRRRIQEMVDIAQRAAITALQEERTTGKRWREAAHDFVAIGIVGYIRYVLAHLRNLLGFATGAILLVLLAISSYPFQPAQLLLTMSWVAILSLVGVTVVIFVQMDRDEVLSWLAKSTPGQVAFSREFLRRIGTYGLVPILGMAAAQFPEVGRFFFFWVEPFLNALK